MAINYTCDVCGGKIANLDSSFLTVIFLPGHNLFSESTGDPRRELYAAAPTTASQRRRWDTCVHCVEALEAFVESRKI